jgi:hypothetical protein
LSEEEYWESNKEYESQENQELPSTFMSEEDIATDTNVIIIPSLKFNLDLQLDNYVETISKIKTKDQLKYALLQVWEYAMNHGALTERMDKLQMDIEMLQMDMGLIDFEIEIVDNDE